MDRDNWICQKCKNDKGALHIHHKTYEYGNNPWDYEDNNFITLCENCHKEEELQKIYFNTTIKFLLKNGMNYYDLCGIIGKVFLEKYDINNIKQL